MKKLPAILTACTSVTLLSAAFFIAGLGALMSLHQMERSFFFALFALACILAIPGLLLYQFASRSLNRKGLLSATLGIGVIGCSALLGSFYLAGYFDPKVALSNGVLKINGRINRETLQSFREFSESTDLRDVRIKLNSPGGDVLAGMAIGREIHRLNLDVEVERQCVSSCANYLFTAGKNKYLRSSGDVRFHGGALQPNFVEVALNMVQKGTQLSIFDPEKLPDATTSEQLREFYGLREDYPFNPAGGILAEKSFFDEIGVSQLTPVFGQYGDYADRFDDGVHDLYYYTPKDFAQLGVSNVHVGASGSNGKAGDSEELFRAKVRAEPMEALETEMNALIRTIEDSMPFSTNQIWDWDD